MLVETSQTPIYNVLYLLNDNYVTVANLNSPTLTRANYMWDESADRIMLNNADENAYYTLYSAISSCNLIIENAPTATEATDQERAEVTAYAKVIRSLCYYVLVNYYADTYEAASAGEKLSVPLITSSVIDAPSEQVTIQEMYDFIIHGVEEAIDGGLPEESMTVIHPNLGAAYALLARVYLQMQDYTKALEYAELALDQNSALYDWNAYYDEHITTIEDLDDYTTLPTPTDYSYVENYYFRCGNSSPNYTTNELDIPVWRAERFEEGDAKFMSRWKYRCPAGNTAPRTRIPTMTAWATDISTGADSPPARYTSSRPSVWPAVRTSPVPWTYSTPCVRPVSVRMCISR